jgi:hypothetical protein
VLGATALTGFVFLLPGLPLFVIGLMIVGAVVYGGKTLWDVIKKNNEEKELIKKINKKIDEQIDYFLSGQAFYELMEYLNEALSEEGFCGFDQSDQSALCSYIEEIEEALWRLMVLVKARIMILSDQPDEEQKYIDWYEGLNDRLVAVRECKRMSYSLYRKANETDYHSTISNQSAIHFNFRSQNKKIKYAKPDQESRWFKSPKTFCMKLGNRLLEFVGGTTIGIATGMGVMELVAGATAAATLLSNPLGWVGLAIIGGGLLFGALTVCIVYTVSRNQDKKIGQLNAEKKNFNIVKSGVESIKDKIQIMNLKNKVNVNNKSEVKNNGKKWKKNQVTCAKNGFEKKQDKGIKSWMEHANKQLATAVAFSKKPNNRNGYRELPADMSQGMFYPNGVASEEGKDKENHSYRHQEGPVHT